MSSPRVLANRYQLDLHAAEGGMGSVWRATDLQLERRVAVKLMSAGYAEHADARARFLREARAAAKIQSPQVVAILDYGVDAETPYIVMEWLDGESLGARLKREGLLSPAATGAVIRQVARGLRAAHELGVVHRDLKPDNLFFQRDHDEETLKILDFGVAKARGQAGEQTRTGVILGSLRYMSPEQARANRDADHRSDLWSLGVIAYRCLSGELPFQGASDGDLLVNICTEQPAPISAHRPELAALDGFFQRCFSKDPAGRFASASELASGYFDALGLDDPSKRAGAVGGVRAPLPSYSLPAPAPPPPLAPLAAPAREPLASAAPADAAPTTAPVSVPSSARASAPSSAGAFAPLGPAPPSAVSAPSIGGAPPVDPASAGAPSASAAQPPWGSPVGVAPTQSSDPASRSAILVASMPPAARAKSKLALAVALGGGVGALLALVGLIVLLGTSSEREPSRAPLASPAATEAPAAPRPEPSDAPEPSRARSAATTEPLPALDDRPREAATSASASAEPLPSATPRASTSSSPSSGGTKPLSRPLIPSNPY